MKDAIITDCLCRCGSVVEHPIRNRAVAGSNPAIGFVQLTVNSYQLSLFSDLGLGAIPRDELGPYLLKTEFFLMTVDYHWRNAQSRFY